MLLTSIDREKYLVDEVGNWSKSYESLWKCPTEEDRYLNVGEETLTWYFVKWIISHQISQLSKIIQYHMIAFGNAIKVASPTQINLGMWSENDFIYSNPQDRGKKLRIYIWTWESILIYCNQMSILPIEVFVRFLLWRSRVTLWQLPR